MIEYYANGNMKTMPDRGITTPITYNHLNLPQVIVKNTQPVTYTYRADGVKVHKSFEVNGQNIETWYLDGFVYTTPYSSQIEVALRETPEAEEMSAAGQRESFELAEKAVIKDPGGPVQQIQSKPDFFATAEGFYDYANFRYIYQYKDHLGNTRLNFGRDEDGVLFTEDSNDYYPFGLNFINPPSRGSAQLFNPSATYKNYKYNGKELQETGMYDYGARFYMPDIGRWGVVDPLAEAHPDMTPFRYSFNNPINATDPTGMLEGWIEQEVDGNKSYTYDANVNTAAEASAAGYSNVTNVYESATIQGSTSVAGIETSNYSYSLNGDGTVMDHNGRFQNSAFETSKGTAIQGMTAGASQLPVGGIKMMGGAGDPFGIWEALGMILGASDSNAKYAVLPLMVVKGQGDDALKMLNAEKGILSAGDALRIEKAATRINKPITVVGSRANGTAGAYSDWDYVIEGGLKSREWSKIKNSLPGAKSTIDNTPRNIDIFTGAVNKSKPNITINPRSK